MIILALDLGSPATKTAATILETDSGVILKTAVGIQISTAKTQRS